MQNEIYDLLLIFFILFLIFVHVFFLTVFVRTFIHSWTSIKILRYQMYQMSSRISRKMIIFSVDNDLVYIRTNQIHLCEVHALRPFFVVESCNSCSKKINSNFFSYLIVISNVFYQYRESFAFLRNWFYDSTFQNTGHGF